LVMADSNLRPRQFTGAWSLGRVVNEMKKCLHFFMNERRSEVKRSDNPAPATK